MRDAVSDLTVKETNNVANELYRHGSTAAGMSAAVAANHLTNAASMIATAAGHATTENAASDAMILAKGNAGLTEMTSKDLKATDTVVAWSGPMSGASMAEEIANVAANAMMDAGWTIGIMTLADLTSGVSKTVVAREVTSDTLTVAGTNRAL